MALSFIRRIQPFVLVFCLAFSLGTMPMYPSMAATPVEQENANLQERIQFSVKWWCGGLCLVLPEASLASAPARSNGIVQKLLGEELTYQIGFWLFNRCGEAKTTFVQTEYQGVYRATLAGRTLGFVDVVLGRYRYSYASYLELSPKGDRLRPLRFTLTKKRIGKESKYSVTYCRG